MKNNKQLKPFSQLSSTLFRKQLPHFTYVNPPIFKHKGETDHFEDPTPQQIEDNTDKDLQSETFEKHRSGRRLVCMTNTICIPFFAHPKLSPIFLAQRNNRFNISTYLCAYESPNRRWKFAKFNYCCCYSMTIIWS